MIRVAPGVANESGAAALLYDLHLRCLRAHAAPAVACGAGVAAGVLRRRGTDVEARDGCTRQRESLVQPLVGERPPCRRFHLESQDVIFLHLCCPPVLPLNEIYLVSV